MNREKIKEELKAFADRMIKLIDDDGITCPRCGEKIYELLPDGVCFDCKRILEEENRLEKLKENVDVTKVEKEQERKDIFG